MTRSAQDIAAEWRDRIRLLPATSNSSFEFAEVTAILDALTAAKAQNEALAKERDEARQFAHEATVALTSMTPGGSEWFAGVFKGTEQYKADIPAIVKYLRENKVYAWQLRFAEKERDELREVNEALATKVKELEAEVVRLGKETGGYFI